MLQTKLMKPTLALCNDCIRLDKSPGALALRLRWYGTGEPSVVFAERKTHRDSWIGEVSVKERFMVSQNEKRNSTSHFSSEEHLY